MPGPQDSVGESYRGARGAEYYAYQAGTATREAVALDDFKYAPFVRPTDVVVDFGCGSGQMLMRLTAAEKVGIEVNEHARRAAGDNGVRAVASARELPDAFADVVVSNHALEHSLTPFEELVALRQLLKPGGRLVLWLPLDDWRSRRERRPGTDQNHHLFGWTPLLLRNLLAEAGYDVERVQVVTHAWPPGHVALRRLPAPVFALFTRGWAVVRHRRQLCAVARSAPAPSRD